MLFYRVAPVHVFIQFGFRFLIVSSISVGINFAWAMAHWINVGQCWRLASLPKKKKNKRSVNINDERFHLNIYQRPNYGEQFQCKMHLNKCNHHSIYWRVQNHQLDRKLNAIKTLWRRFGFWVCVCGVVDDNFKIGLCIETLREKYAHTHSATNQ